MSVPIIGAPPPSLELLTKYMQIAEGFQRRDVLTASLNLALDVLVKKHPNRVAAMADLDRLCSNMRNALGNAYNAAGQRKGIIAPTNATEGLGG
jgi:hypothetical protein